MNPAEIANIARTEERLWWFRGMREIAFAFLDPLFRRGGIERVFEGGSGTGYFAAVVAARYGVPVVAADLDAHGARMAARRQGVAAVQANLLSLPFPNAGFDLVLLMDVLAHFGEGDDLRALRETARLLRPGGHLLLRTAALKIFRSRHSEFVWERQRFSARRLRRLACDAGLRAERLTYSNCLLSPLALLKFRVWEPLARAAPASGLRPLPGPLEALFYAALRTEAAWIRSGRTFPFGQSLWLLAQRPAAPPSPP
ncbi:MAG TPA: class I SAM-dependent methyltransferase [Bryobacteraceae bacterium]|nr:class I SAM-dependent methyltransferase [Bryobacteraceae bacterium]